MEAGGARPQALGCQLRDPPVYLYSGSLYGAQGP